MISDVASSIRTETHRNVERDGGRVENRACHVVTRLLRVPSHARGRRLELVLETEGLKTDQSAARRVDQDSGETRTKTETSRGDGGASTSVIAASPLVCQVLSGALGRILLSETAISGSSWECGPASRPAWTAAADVR